MRSTSRTEPSDTNPTSGLAIRLPGVPRSSRSRDPSKLFFAEANNPSLDNWFPNDWFEGVDRLRAFDSSLRVPDGYEGIDLTGRPPLVDIHCHAVSAENAETELHAESAEGTE